LNDKLIQNEILEKKQRFIVLLIIVDVSASTERWTAIRQTVPTKASSKPKRQQRSIKGCFFLKNFILN